MSRYNYFAEIVPDGYAFTAAPSANFGFMAVGISLLNRGAQKVEYSFDGTNVHGDLDPADESVDRTFTHRLESKLWLRAADGYSSIRVEAWGGWGRT